jgi:hypothetical protein
LPIAQALLNLDGYRGTWSNDATSHQIRVSRDRVFPAPSKHRIHRKHY